MSKEEKLKKDSHKKECNCNHEECKCNDKECNCQHSKEENEQIDKLQEKIKELENKLLLNQAELINYRKRKDEETSSLLKFANQDFMLDLIPILDNFERAIQRDDNDLTDELSKFLAGFKMMYGHFVETMKKYGLEEIPADGLDFDPTCMQALMTDKVEEKADNVVLEVFMKGYRLKDRVIRPATVKVNKLED